MIEELLAQFEQKPRNGGQVLRWTEEEAALRVHRFQQLRLRCERFGLPRALKQSLRVVSTACWEFPVYSQTFVYQELSELARNGFSLRFLYSKLNPRSYLPRQFSAVWRAKRKLVLHYKVCEIDYAHYRERMPAKVNALEDLVCTASGMSLSELREHHHFKQAFAFTRMVEACRPDYLHSYFFYEGTLFTLFASYLLDIPRGVSCYADHMLDDYALKVVPLHLEQSSLVIATSARIKRELLALAPKVNPDRILVKPNAIDCERFPATSRREPAAGQPFRLVCVSRIEPKKGILHLVDAVRLLIDRKVNLSVHVLGGVDNDDASKQYAQAVEQRIGELGLKHIFHLEGRRSGLEIRKFLAEAHLFVAPFVETATGDKDGIPTALLEAMASGLPAVATDAGSITEVIDSGEDGILVPQADARALSDAILELLTDPTRREQFGLTAADKIRRCFDVRICEKAFHQRIRAVTAAEKVARTSSQRVAGSGA